MSMDAKMAGVGVGTIEHDIVGSQEARFGHDFEAKAEDLASIDGVGVWVADLEGGDAGAHAVEVELVMGLLSIEAGDELGVGAAGWICFKRKTRR